MHNFDKQVHNFYMKRRFLIILLVLFSLTFVGATDYNEKLKLTFNNGKTIISTYIEEDYDITNHLVYEQAVERKIISPLEDKIDQVKTLRESGKSEKDAILYCFPSIEKTIDNISKKVLVKPTDSKVFFMPNQTPMFVVSREKNGLALDEEKLYKNIYDALIYSKENVKVETKQLYPSVCVKDNENTFYERGRFTTSIQASSTNRKDNIKKALSSINGSVLSVGETLSFNNKTGPRNEQNGYKLAKIIKGNEYVDGLGGGVCQASTTLYNCALLSGVEVLQVSGHSLLPSYVLPSFDAMVNTGSSDLVIKNNTGGKLYIKAYANEEQATVIFYGKKNEYEISRKSVTIKKGEMPKDKIVLDTKNKYFSNEDTTLKKRISYSQPSVKSQGYLVYKKNGKTKKEILIREDYYNSKSGIIAERVEKDDAPLFFN